MLIDEKKKIRNAVALFIKNTYSETSEGKKAHTKLKIYVTKPGNMEYHQNCFRREHREKTEY